MEEIQQDWFNKAVPKLQEKMAQVLSLPVSFVSQILDPHVVQELLSMIQTSQEEANRQLATEISSKLADDSVSPKFFEENVHQVFGFSSTISGEEIKVKGISDFLIEQGWVIS